MNKNFIELKSTDNTTIYLRPEAIGGFEVVPATTRVDGHIKVFVGGFKFLVTIEKDELLKKLKEG